MTFTMYKEHLNENDIFYLPVSVTERAKTTIEFNPYQEDNVLYCRVTKVNDNKSICGTILNGSIDFGEVGFVSMTRPYTTENHSHFMWNNEIFLVGPDTTQDLIERFPEKFI